MVVLLILVGLFCVGGITLVIVAKREQEKQKVIDDKRWEAIESERKNHLHKHYNIITDVGSAFIKDNDFSKVVELIRKKGEISELYGTGAKVLLGEEWTVQTYGYLPNNGVIFFQEGVIAYSGDKIEVVPKDEVKYFLKFHFSTGENHGVSYEPRIIGKEESVSANATAGAIVGGTAGAVIAAAATQERNERIQQEKQQQREDFRAAVMAPSWMEVFCDLLEKKPLRYLYIFNLSGMEELLKANGFEKWFGKTLKVNGYEAMFYERHDFDGYIKMPLHWQNLQAAFYGIYYDDYKHFNQELFNYSYLIKKYDV